MEREIEEMKKEGINPWKTIIMPQYTFDKILNVFREYKKPPESLYIGLGHDENPPEDKVKHYRRYYPDELENVKELLPNPSPFTSYVIKRGQTRGASGGWWPFGKAKEDESGEASTEQEVGIFKCLIDVVSENQKKQHMDEKDDRLDMIISKLNDISIKKTGKRFEFDPESLSTMEGKNEFRF